MMNSVSPYLLILLPVSPSKLGYISSLFLFVNLILLFPAGILLDKYQPKWLVAISIVITILGILFFIYFQSISSVIIWRSLSGIAGAFSYLSCVKILSTEFSRRYLGLLLGTTGIIIMSAGVISQYPLIWLIKHVGLINTMVIDIGLGILVIFLVLTITSKKSYSNIKNNMIHKNITSVFLNLKNWLIATYACLTNFPLFVLGALWGNLYLQYAQGVSIDTASLISSMIFIGNMFGATSLGYISDKIHTRKSLMIVSALLMFISVTLIMILPGHSSNRVLYFIFFLLGFSTGAQTLAYAASVDINHSINTAKATSL
ncbi:MAG TPA: MFS transporter, partial [Gammaproteobacteria bacterium]|nr:MFS transporter [Gammaproteobacteria bacterium]